MSAPDKYMTTTDVVAAIRLHARRTPTARAVFDGSRELTFGDLELRMRRVRNGVRHGLGLSPGDRVAVLAPNCLEYPEVVLGLGWAEVTAVLVNARLTAAEIGDICDDMGVRAVFVHSRYADLMEEAAPAAAAPIVVVGGAGYDDWLAQSSSASADGVCDPDRPFLIPFTGGTTGRAKGVLLSHRSRAALYEQMRRSFACYATAGRNLTVAPMYHGAGFNFFLAALYAGGSVSVMSRYDPEDFLDRIEREKITDASVVPTHLSAVLALGDQAIMRRDTSSLLAFFSNGAPLNSSQKQQLVDTFGPAVLFDAYGGTEAGLISVLAPDDQLRMIGSVGRLFPQAQLQVIGPDGAPVGTGETGELMTRSPFQFDGYSGQPPWPRDEWFSAGDIGRMDAQGYLYLVDRKDWKIITGGLNVFPREVESAIATHPAVQETVVFGVPHPYWGEAVTAAVVLRPGAVASATDLIEHAARTVARYKLPKHLHLLDALPRTDVGKIQRQALQDLYAGLEPPATQ